jgi:ankyrin repeat protein
MIGIVLVMALLALASMSICLFMIGQSLLRRTNGAEAFVAGAIPLFAFCLLLMYRLSLRGVGDHLTTGVAVFFFAPAVLGLISVVVSLRSWKNIGALQFAARCLTIAAGVAMMLKVATLWLAMDARSRLYHAVFDENAAAVRSVLAEGAARDKKDEAYRQDLLNLAARRVNDDIVAQLLDAGADPNIASNGKIALVEAMTSAPDLRLDPLDPVVHLERKRRTIKVLLDKGADPNAVSEHGTPGLIVWRIADPQMIALLKAKGARDIETAAANFEAIVTAAERGDASKVREVIKHPGAAEQQDKGGRQPLVIAAAGGHLPVVEALLNAYGDSVSCWMVAAALDEAAKNHHVDIFKRLLGLCVNPYGESPVVVAARHGDLEVLHAALTAQYPITGQAALEAAATAGHREMVRELIKAGATVDPKKIPATPDPTIAEMLAKAPAPRQ